VIVREWERRAAVRDLAPVRKRMTIERHAGAHWAAIKAAETILDKQPGDNLALRCYEEGVKRLQEQAERYRDPGRGGRNRNDQPPGGID
jgi:hypothetical protein